MGNVADILFPPLAGILAIFSLAIGITKARNKPQKFLGIFAHVPSIVGGGLFVFMCVVMIIPPFTLGALFIATEISEEVHIQQAVSPDGIRVADVYFRGAGAYSSSSGRVIVRVRHKIVPFLERDILYENSNYMREEIGDYIEWRDSNTIYITETKREMPVGIVQAVVSESLCVRPITLLRGCDCTVSKSSSRQRRQGSKRTKSVPLTALALDYTDRVDSTTAHIQLHNL
jgi:hypothetical protein